MRSLLPSLMVVFSACDPPHGVSAAEWDRLSTFALVAPPDDPSDAVADDPAAAELGRQLFFDPRLSGPLTLDSDLGQAGEIDRVSCASCHDPADGGTDHRSDGPTSLGVGWTGRNAPTVLGAAGQRWMFWDGRKDSLWSQALGPTESPAEHDSSRLAVAHLLAERYRAPYEALFGPLPSLGDRHRFPLQGRPGDPPWDGMAPGDQDQVDEVFCNFGKVLEAYERELVPGESRFDRWLAGVGSLSPAEVRGARLFVGRAACDECHSGPLLADGRFHNVGVAQVGPHVAEVDPGRAAGIDQVLADPFNRAGRCSDDRDSAHLDRLAARPRDLGAFRTPTLRNLTRTAPYTHDGSLQTLWDVLDHYRFGGGTDGFVGEPDPSMRPLALSDDDLRDLVAFLAALDGDPLDPDLVDAPVLP